MEGLPWNNARQIQCSVEYNTCSCHLMYVFWWRRVSRYMFGCSIYSYMYLLQRILNNGDFATLCITLHRGSISLFYNFALLTESYEQWMYMMRMITKQQILKHTKQTGTYIYCHRQPLQCEWEQKRKKYFQWTIKFVNVVQSRLILLAAQPMF